MYRQLQSLFLQPKCDLSLHIVKYITFWHCVKPLAFRQGEVFLAHLPEEPYNKGKSFGGNMGIFLSRMWFLLGRSGT